MDVDESLSFTQADTSTDIKRRVQEVRSKAIMLLARRDHSFQELEFKLSRFFSDEVLVQEQLQNLADEGLQSDFRFTEIMIRSSLSKSHGLSRIKNTLRAKGISGAMIEKAFAELDIDWLEQLKYLSIRKYGDRRCEDDKEKARRIRFFQYRGYAMSDIYTVLGND